MSIKKGKARNFYFCDTCGKHFNAAKQPEYCFDCLTGPDLNKDTLDIIMDLHKKAVEKKDPELADHVWERVAQLFLDKLVITQARLRGMPDGPTKDQKCKALLEEFAMMARKIYDPEKEE